MIVWQVFDLPIFLQIQQFENLFYKNMEVFYRKATLKDLNELVRLRVEFLKEVQPAETHQFSEESLRVSLREYLSRAMQADEFVAWLGICNTEIVATSGLCFFQITPGFTLIDGKLTAKLPIY